MGGLGGSKIANNDVYSTENGTKWKKIDANVTIFSPRLWFGTAVFKQKL